MLRRQRRGTVGARPLEGTVAGWGRIGSDDYELRLPALEVDRRSLRPCRSLCPCLKPVASQEMAKYMDRHRSRWQPGRQKIEGTVIYRLFLDTHGGDRGSAITVFLAPHLDSIAPRWVDFGRQGASGFNRDWLPLSAHMGGQPTKPLFCSRLPR